MPDKLAKVRKAFGLCYDKHYSDLDPDGLTKCILNTSITIEGGVCPACCPAAQREGIWMPVNCYKCGGTGKIPDKTITVREAIERVMG